MRRSTWLRTSLLSMNILVCSAVDGISRTYTEINGPIDFSTTVGVPTQPRIRRIIRWPYDHPPCAHDRVTLPEEMTDVLVCTRDNQDGVDYWSSRPDHMAESDDMENISFPNISTSQPNKKQPQETGLFPHCHGHSIWKFCHAHPGGNKYHDHLKD
jgi:hypothetical protein